MIYWKKQNNIMLILMQKKKIGQKKMTEYFTLRQLIEATGEEYFAVDVKARYYTVFTRKKTHGFMTVEIIYPFSKFPIDLDKKYELSEKGIEELESDLFEFMKTQEDKLKEGVEVYEDMNDIRIVYAEPEKAYLSKKMLRYLYELMGEELPSKYEEREEEF